MRRRLRLKKWNKLAAAAAALVLTLCGCAIPQILDGPGMISDRPWRGFSLSRSDSNARYNFWFTVYDDSCDFLLTGQCRDESGNEYTIEAGVPLFAEDVRYLRESMLAELPDAVEDESIRDDSEVKLVLTLFDGTQVEKVLSGDVSIEIYQRFLPYFKNLH